MVLTEQARELAAYGSVSPSKAPVKFGRREDDRPIYKSIWQLSCIFTCQTATSTTSFALTPLNSLSQIVMEFDGKAKLNCYLRL